MALVRDYRRIKTRIKSLLLYFQIEIPLGMDTPKWPIKFIRWLENLQTNQINIQLTIKSMLTHYKFIDEQLKDISNKIRSYCKRHHKLDYELLRSVPGIAGLTASYILSEIGDLRKFRSLKKLASYVGFIPGVQQSGDTVISLGANPRANRHVRNMIIEASWIAVRTDPVLQNYYRSHAGKNSKAVIFKVGRKLLSKILAVIKTETPYQVGVIQ